MSTILITMATTMTNMNKSTTMQPNTFPRVTTSLLLKLPAELRLQIWHKTLDPCTIRDNLIRAWRHTNTFGFTDTVNQILDLHIAAIFSRLGPLCHQAKHLLDGEFNTIKSDLWRENIPTWRREVISNARALRALWVDKEYIKALHAYFPSPRFNRFEILLPAAQRNAICRRLYRRAKMVYSFLESKAVKGVDRLPAIKFGDADTSGSAQSQWYKDMMKKSTAIWKWLAETEKDGTKVTDLGLQTQLILATEVEPYWRRCKNLPWKQIAVGTLALHVAVSSLVGVLVAATR